MNAPARNLVSENRQHERHDVGLEVQLRCGGEAPLRAISRDLSIGGMRLELDPGGPRLQVGQRLELGFRLPALDEALEVPATVRWIDRIDDRVAGVQFLRGLRAMEVWAIDRLRRGR